MQPAIFLDRDGVIIENRPDYVRSLEEVKFLPGSLAALSRLARSPYRIVIVTNQAGIGRGLLTPETVAEINRRLVQEIESAGGRVDGIYVCPHKPDDGCNCRKPQPGLIFQAASDLSVDLARSVLIGDNLSDIQAGKAAGLGQVALVRTGLGEKFAWQLTSTGFAGVNIYTDLAEALESMINVDEIV
jgi:D-glycero-D-manno-heptose 1,7-bisphosphate phosphatase